MEKKVFEKDTHLKTNLEEMTHQLNFIYNDSDWVCPE